MRDRGTKKWTSLMLPEHVVMIKELWAESAYKEKPNLSDQQLEEIEFNLQEALAANLEVKIKYFKTHDYHLVYGKVNKSDNFLVINELKIELSEVLEINII